MCGQEPLIEVALELERVALADEYFISRKLYPNVDFYSGLIYKGTVWWGGEAHGVKWDPKANLDH